MRSGSRRRRAADQLERGFNQGFRLRAGVEHVRRNDERQTPEFAPPGDLGQRLAGRPSSRKIGKARGGGLAERRFRRRNQLSGGHFAGFAEGEPRLTPRLFDPGAVERLGEPDERLRSGRRGAHSERAAQAT